MPKENIEKHENNESPKYGTYPKACII